MKKLTRGVFKGREFETRSEYRRELAKVEGHGEKSYKKAYEEERARDLQREFQEQQKLGSEREEYIRQVFIDVQQYERAREYRYDYFSAQAVRGQRFETHDEAMHALGDLYRQAVLEDWDPRPHGAYAQLLEASGMRSEDAEYPVGETPGGNK